MNLFPNSCLRLAFLLAKNCCVLGVDWRPQPKQFIRSFGLFWQASQKGCNLKTYMPTPGFVRG